MQKSLNIIHKNSIYHLFVHLGATLAIANSLWYNIMRIFGQVDTMDVKVNDIIVTKKPHPCKNSEFLVLRIGADFKIRCTKCGREVMVPRAKIEKNIKKIITPQNDNQ